MEKKIMEIGFGNMEFIDQSRAYKLLDADRIDELEEMREKRQREEKERPIQMNLFDFI